MNLEKTKSARETINDSKPSDEETNSKPLAAQATGEVSRAHNQALTNFIDESRRLDKTRCNSQRI